MSKWNYVAMGQAGLTGWTREVAKPVARAVARRTGRPEAEILSLIGAVFLAITVIDFLRNVDAVIAAGRTGPQPVDDAPRRGLGRGWWRLGQCLGASVSRQLCWSAPWMRFSARTGTPSQLRVQRFTPAAI